MPGFQKPFAPGWRSPWLAAAGLGLVLAGVVVATLSDYGVTWDERLYFEDGRSYVAWLRGAAGATFDDTWGLAHPPFHKWLGGLTHHVLHERLELLDGLDAYRMATVLFVFALSVGLFRFGTELFGPGPALAATLSLFLMPRVFFHAHIGAFDYAVAALTFCAGAAYFKSLAQPKWLLAAAFLLGLTLGTKLNGAVAVAPMGALLVLRCLELRRNPRALGSLLLHQIPMLVVPPLVVLAIWPWLWPDPLARSLQLVGSQVQHSAIPTRYLGQTYAEAPFHYPFVMTLLTVPVVVLLAAFTGLFRLARPGQRTAMIFLLVGAVAPLAVLALPGIPKSGGVRHFLPAYPFLALLAAAGLREITDRLRRPRGLPATVAIYCAVLFASVLPGLVRIHPYEITWFNAFAGGYRGAAERGFDLDYWGGSYRAILPWMNAHPERVYWFPFASRLPHFYQETGDLAAGIRLAGPREADTLVLINRRSFFDAEMDLCFESGRPLSAAGPPGLDLVRICERRPSGAGGRRPKGSE